MSIQVRLIEGQISNELKDIGIAEPQVNVTTLAGDGSALFIVIVSASFEETSILDREMRIRPAVARAFARMNVPRTEFILEPLTPGEFIETQSSSTGTTSFAPPNEAEDDALGRAEWRRQVDDVLDVLRKSHYVVSRLDAGNVFAAEKTSFTKQRIVIGFASSLSAKTVDQGVRKTMQTAHESQRLAGSYYVSAYELENPFANQKPAKWLELLTVSAFLRSLASTTAIATAQLGEVKKDNEKLEASQRGPIIDSDIRRADFGEKRHFSEYVQEWMERKPASLLLVLAPAGHGKTTLCKETTRQLAEDHLARGRGVVPLMTAFESVRRAFDFESLLHKRLGLIADGSISAFVNLLQRGEALLVVDGFDELADDAGVDVAEAQIRSMRFLLQGQAKIILAGRSLFAENFALSKSIKERVRSLLGNVEIDVIEVLPFGPEHARDYIKSREGLTEHQKEALAEYCVASLDHELLASNPLFLRILSSLAATDRLPAPNVVSMGVNALLDRVCEREEDRQHLGIGLQGQRRFLRSLATEMQVTGKNVPRVDVTFHAEMSLESVTPEQVPDICARLSTHALLKAGREDGVEFVHPLIRDVVLGSAIADDLAQKNDKLLEHRDIPEGAVQFLAVSDASFDAALGGGWLSFPTKPAATRRNLFRIVSKRAQHRKEGNPREWIEGDDWIRGQILNSLDFSNMTLASLSFDRLTFVDCVFTNAMLDDCDLRSTTFRGCRFEKTLFVVCRSDGHISIESCVVKDALIQSERTQDVAESANALRSALLRADWGASFTTPVAQNAVERCQSLMRLILTQFVDLDPPRFHTRPEESFVMVGGTDREKTAVQKVLLPGVYQKLCDITIHAGSKRRMTIDKRFQASVVEFLRTGIEVDPLARVSSQLAARAARYLS